MKHDVLKAPSTQSFENVFECKTFDEQSEE